VVEDTLRDVLVGRQRIRISVRAGDAADAGQPTRPPLVLANGIGANLELLQPFVDEIDPAIEVLRFDVPGVGGSPLPVYPYRFTGLARLLGRLLDELGYDRVDLLGLSWGGALAQQFALCNPRRCRRLVLASTATGSLMVPGGPRVLTNMVMPRRHSSQDYTVQLAADVYGGKLRDDPTIARRLIPENLKLGAGLGYAYQLMASVGWTSLPLLPLIRQPCLILAGNDDPIVPLANARIMRRLIPHARLYIYKDGHLGLITRAHELGQIVADFVTEPASMLRSDYTE
jgi:poly(3-hydroxyalkanoate) depolymerase